jgi:two-component system, OmpR family, response regulator CpxR
MKPILIVDDDIELCNLLREYLTREGFEVAACHDGERGLAAARSGRHALVILDVMLPRLGGFELLRRLRASSPVPVLMLTARGDDVDRIVGLEIGADDYLPKPFNPRELVARIQAVLRRTAEPAIHAPALAPAEPIRVGSLKIDPGTRETHRDNQRLDLTSVEFDLLQLLMRSAGVVVSRDALSRAALGRGYHPLDRSLDMHVSNLRRKLGADHSPAIKTVRSAGYLLAHIAPAPEEDGAHG